MTETVHYETRKKLISRLAFSFEAELLDKDCKALYDDNFLLRMGQETGRLLQSYTNTLGIMLVIDVVILLLISGTSFKMKILGNEISNFPGLVEIGIIISSLAYVSSTRCAIIHTTYKELIKSLMGNKNVKCNPIFYMSSLFSVDYVKEVIEVRRGALRSGFFQKLSYSILTIMTVTIPVSLYIFHFVSVWLAIHHIHDVKVFGTLATNLINIAVVVTNIHGFLLYFVILECSFKFRASLPKNGS